MTTIPVERELLERVTDSAEFGYGITTEDLHAMRTLLSEQPQVGAGPDLKQLEDALDDVCGQEGVIPTGVPLYTISLTEAAEAFRRLTTQPPARHDHGGEVPEIECRRLLFGFGLDCNIIGLQGAAENLHRGMKAASAALTHSQQGAEE